MGRRLESLLPFIRGRPEGAFHRPPNNTGEANARPRTRPSYDREPFTDSRSPRMPHNEFPTQPHGLNAQPPFLIQNSPSPLRHPPRENREALNPCPFSAENHPCNSTREQAFAFAAEHSASSLRNSPKQPHQFKERAAAGLSTRLTLCAQCPAMFRRTFAGWSNRGRTASASTA